MSDIHFPRPEITPTIYAYRVKDSTMYKDSLKVGYTTRDARTRINEQIGTTGQDYDIVVEQSAMRNDGTSFVDHDVHRMLEKVGIQKIKNEVYRCEKEDVLQAISAVINGEIGDTYRENNFDMRPEQKEAVLNTANYYREFKENEPSKIPKFLWNAKMRFGKTFTSYQLALEMGWSKVLVLTFKPAVQNSWEQDLVTHKDFKGWQFITSYDNFNESKPCVCFGSFQDYLGKNSAGGIKLKNEWVHLVDWDCVIFDEYHYGAWRENAKDLIESEDEESLIDLGKEIKEFDQDLLPIKSNHCLYLSGTPFRALEQGEFMEDQIFNWTYTDEQKAKAEWAKDSKNPYASLPKMAMLTYKIPNEIAKIAEDEREGEDGIDFDLNIFFKAKFEENQNIETSRFINENEVQQWLDLIRGLNRETGNTPLPFKDVWLLSHLTHTFWFLPDVAACHAMKNLLRGKHNVFFNDYQIVVAAGKSAGIGVKALAPVRKAMQKPLESKSITLSCGKLTTGVTIKPWAGIFMLRNTSSPETYFQAAFRVQSPWTIKNLDGKHPNDEEILKDICYIFDFAPNRALKKIADYGTRLNLGEDNSEKKIADFIKYLPILHYGGISLTQINAHEVLEMAMSGTNSTLLARRWQSNKLVKVDNETLEKLMNNKELLEALMQLEAFRNLNDEISTIISQSKSIKKKKKDDDFDKKKKKQLSDDEKKEKKGREKVRDNLIKFATRIPVFMYLTDFRERSLKEVISHVEPGLFKKVTGLNINDFEELTKLGLFNASLMNSAVHDFKRYEDASLEYVGINRHIGEDIGLWDRTIKNIKYTQVT